MGLRLIRANSDTPNVSNADDARMVRYAYGGYSGFVQGKGSELECVPNGKTLTVNSGVIVLQGWEVEIDSNGWSMQVSENNTEPLYFTVYCEVNLSLGTAASIKSTYDNSDYPTIEHGDDLTAIPNGIARIEICHFKAQSGKISNLEKIISAIPYVKTVLETFEQRLYEQGFRTASVENGEIVLNDDWTDAVTAGGNVYPNVILVKSGKIIILEEIRVASSKTFYFKNGELNIDTVICKIPEMFAPSEDVVIKKALYVLGDGGYGGVTESSESLTFKTNGDVRLNLHWKVTYATGTPGTKFQVYIYFSEKTDGARFVWIKNFGEES